MKKVLAIAVAVVMLVGLVGVFAAPADANTMTARFNVADGFRGADVEFSMISECEEMVIHITDDVEILFEGYVPMSDECDGLTRDVREVLFGRTLQEVLTNRNMTITYSFVTASIPAQTTPSSIVVLFESIVALPAIDIVAIDGDIADVDLDGYVGIVTLPGEIDFDWENYEFELPELNGEIVVNNEIIDAASPFWNDEGVLMVPLRAIAEALGYDVVWNGYTQSIQLGVAHHIFIGRTEVYVGRMAPIAIPAAPVIIDGLTFVPLYYFRGVLGRVAFVFEGQVVITDAEYNDMF